MKIIFGIVKESIEIKRNSFISHYEDDQRWKYIYRFNLSI